MWSRNDGVQLQAIMASQERQGGPKMTTNDDYVSSTYHSGAWAPYQTSPQTPTAAPGGAILPVEVQALRLWDAGDLALDHQPDRKDVHLQPGLVGNLSSLCEPFHSHRCSQTGLYTCGGRA